MTNTLRLNDFLPYRLSLLSNLMSGVIAKTYEDKFAISMPEWRIMMVLAQYPMSSAEEVCQHTRIEKSVVSRAVARLIKRHLIVKEMDKADRRRSILHLSQTGVSVYEEVLPIAIDYEQHFLQALNAEEITTLHSLIDKMLVVSQKMENIHED